MAAAWLREEGEAGPLGTQMHRPRPAIMVPSTALSGSPGPCCSCSSRAQPTPAPAPPQRGPKLLIEGAGAGSLMNEAKAKGSQLPFQMPSSVL